MANIAKELEKIAENLGVDRKRSIGEVAKELKVRTHVIRFWEENFSQIKPEIGAGNRRYYYNKQLKILRRIKKFLYEDGYTISGLKKLLNKKHKDEFILETAANLDVVIDNKEQIEIDDFLPEKELSNGEKSEINLPNLKIDANAKLLDFATVKVEAIDSQLRFKINEKLKNIKDNLEKLKDFR